MPAGQTGIEFSNVLDSSKNYRALYYFYYFNGGGVAAGDINNDGLTDLYFTANSRGNNKLYLNKGHMQFEDISAKAGVGGTADWSTGVAMADVNADGYLDIYVCSVNQLYDFKGHNALYINNKDNTFTESSAQYGLDLATYATQSAFFDYDLDGDLDCYVLNQSQKPSENLRDTSFRREFNEPAGDRLLRNDVRQNGKFTDVSAEAGIYRSSLGYGLGLSVADLNIDGFPDIYVGNDFHENDYCYLNDGKGHFSEQGAALFNHYSRFSMGNDVGDFDNDGLPDIFTADMLPPDEEHLKTYSGGEGFDVYEMIITRNGYQRQYSRNCLQRNNGPGKGFSDVALLYGIYATDWSWSPLLADFDNDGFKDLFVAAGIPKRTVDLDFTLYMNNLKIQAGQDPKEAYAKALQVLPDGASHNFLFQGKGAAGFTDKSAEWGFREKGYFTGAAHADLDNDGDLDIVLNPINNKAFVYRNNSPATAFLDVQLQGQTPNTFGIGAKVWCFLHSGLQYQEFQPVKGFQSSSLHPLHFGWASADAIDSLLVVWPDARYQVLRAGALAQGRLLLRQEAASGQFHHGAFFQKQRKSLDLKPIDLPTNWKHSEDAFNDFTQQYLLPHQFSTRGPQLATADVNGDGWDDFYVCGAMGQPGALFIQRSDGSLERRDEAVFAADQASEDVDALFFDANGDRRPDLLVAGGGNVYPSGHPALADRLYLNDGKGHFSKETLPALLFNKSTVAAGDLDGDGDQDLFFGTYGEPGRFGTPPASALLLNDGKGQFAPAPVSMIRLDKAGFVMDADITDLNGDGKNELIVAGEWTPPMVFWNRGGSFERKLLDGSGLWQCLYRCDINHDGAPDYLAGNWGNNSKLKATKEQPIRLYVQDFDQNGALDPVVSWQKGGKDYPFLGRDELEKNLPFLKKKFPRFALFAGKTMDEVFDLNRSGLNRYTVEWTASSVFVNDGKGQFARQDLPLRCQYAPIFAFAETELPGLFIAAGNFSGVRPYEGAYDAGALVGFGMGAGLFEPDGTVLSNRGEVRDLAWIKTPKGNVLVVACNNAPLRFYALH